MSSLNEQLHMKGNVSTDKYINAEVTPSPLKSVKDFISTYKVISINKHKDSLNILQGKH